ncbi:hypothetical protein KIPB_012507, partial [Kipferlia bialata]|eukprot:g12507.t1
MLEDRGHAVIQEVGTSVGVPRILAALEGLGVARENVHKVFITHCHLDHSGGVGTLLQSLPNAVCVTHPKSMPHIVSPNRALVPSATAVYGQEIMDRDYPSIMDIDADRC